jgi:hypothetical protein
LINSLSSAGTAVGIEHIEHMPKTNVFKMREPKTQLAFRVLCPFEQTTSATSTRSCSKAGLQAEILQASDLLEKKLPEADLSFG